MCTYFILLLLLLLLLLWDTSNIICPANPEFLEYQVNVLTSVEDAECWGFFNGDGIVRQGFVLWGATGLLEDMQQKYLGTLEIGLCTGRSSISLLFVCAVISGQKPHDWSLPSFIL
jgi:hypothetical protein